MKPSILSYSRVLRPLLIDWRLDEQLLQPALTLELQLLINSTSSHQINEDLLSHIIQYHPHLNAAQLKNELIVLLSQHNITPTIPEMIHWFNPCLICALIHTSPYSQLLQHFLALPPTTSSCERSFSGLRRLKTYLRSTMSQEIVY